MTRMKVLEVIEASGAGVGRHVIGLCCGLVSEGHEVTVAYSPYRMDEAFERFVAERQGEIRFFPLEVRRQISPATDLRGVLQLLRLVGREGPFDVIHGHSSKGGALARVAGLLSAVPVVYTPHSLIMSCPVTPRPKAVAYGLIELLLGRLASSKIIAVSEEEREFVLGLKLVSDKRVAVIENGLDEEDFERPSETPVREGLDLRPLTFGSVMRFSSQKAPGHLVEALVRVAEALPQVPMRLLIAGNGDLFDEVKEQVEKSGWAERISLLGWRDDTGAVLRELDVFVLPSLYEGFSYTVLEAMAARLPVVSTMVFGMRRTLAQVPGNVLVPVGDPEALARGMEGIATLAEPTLLRPALRKVGEANRDHVRANFTQSGVTRRTVELYQELCGRRTGSPSTDCVEGGAARASPP